MSESIYELRRDERGRPHGLEREWDEQGRLRYRARYRHGLQIGKQEQWDERGRLVITTCFVGGTGLDLWYCGANNWEERHFERGERHGLERMWIGTGRVYREERFAGGLEHGIARAWNDLGRLRRGYPQYFVAGKKVDRRTYERARENDPTLPARTAEDDTPRRTPPPELIAASRRLRGRSGGGTKV